jgi:hypothetical protein
VYSPDMVATPGHGRSPSANLTQVAQVSNERAEQKLTEFSRV